jgi:hypothetical protein
MEVPNTRVQEHEQQWLGHMAKGKKLAIDIGTCYGHSAIGLALGAERVIAVDDFMGPREPQFPDSERYDILRCFLENTKDYPNILLQIVNHDKFIPPSDCDIAFIDGDHQYESAKRDILKFLNIKGIFLCGHDYLYWPSVKAAVDELIPGVQVYEPNIWYKQL